MRPVETERNQPPPPGPSLKPGTTDFVNGTGMSAIYANVVGDDELLTFLAPYVVPPGGHPIGPSVGGAYVEDLAPGQQFSVLWGVTALTPMIITDKYSVKLIARRGTDEAEATMAYDLATPSHYKWVTVAGDIVDSAHDPAFMTVQNATRLIYLVAAGMLPANVMNPGTTTEWIVHVRRIDSGQEWENMITMTAN